MRSEGFCDSWERNRAKKVWIGGRTPETASIIPPPWEEIENLLGDLEYFIHNQELQLPPIIRVAITHYQFEAIHPFLDGNGRTGRMLIMLQLLDYGMLQQPVLYLSDFIDKNRSLYYDSLSGVSHASNMRQWLLFFLDGVKTSAEQSAKALKGALLLKKELRQLLGNEYNQSKTAEELLDYIFNKPIVTREQVIEGIPLPSTSANRYLNRFVELGILEEISGLKRNRIFAFRAYLKLFK